MSRFRLALLRAVFRFATSRPIEGWRLRLAVWAARRILAARRAR